MKKFTNARITLFDSTVACFKLSVEATFSSPPKQDGSTSSLAYVTTPKLNPNTNKWSEPIAVLDPNIYLVFTYKGDTYQNTKTVYTSYPQLFRIREAMETIKNYLVTGKGFSEVDGALYADPSMMTAVTDIGKSKKSITFQLQSVAVENSTEKIPGVAIHISDCEYLSLLSADEFFTIYTIVKDIDLANIQTQLSIAYLNGIDSAPQNYNAYPQRQQYTGYSAPSTAPQQAYGNYSNNGGYGYSQPAAQNVPAFNRNNGMRRQPAAPAPDYSQPAAQYAPPANPFPETEATPKQTTNLPPRANKPLVNLNTVEETPVNNMSFDDVEAVNAIFGMD